MSTVDNRWEKSDNLRFEEIIILKILKKQYDMKGFQI